MKTRDAIDQIRIESLGSMQKQALFKLFSVETTSDYRNASMKRLRKKVRNMAKIILLVREFHPDLFEEFVTSVDEKTVIELASYQSFLNIVKELDDCRTL